MGVSIADEDVQHNGSQQRLNVGSRRDGLDDPGDTCQRWPAIFLILLVWQDSCRLAEVFLMEALDRAVLLNDPVVALDDDQLAAVDQRGFHAGGRDPEVFRKAQAERLVLDRVRQCGDLWLEDVGRRRAVHWSSP